MIKATCQISAVKKQGDVLKILLHGDDTSLEIPTDQTMTVYFQAQESGRVLCELTHQELALLEHAKNMARLQIAVSDAEAERDRLKKEVEQGFQSANETVRKKRDELNEVMSLQDAPNSAWRQYLDSLTTEEA